MDLATFVKVVKRRNQIGTLSDTADQTTQDIISFYNNRSSRFWRAWAWDWSMEEISQAVAASVSDFTLSSNSIGQVKALRIKDKAGRLVVISLNYYLNWKFEENPVPGQPQYVIRMGRNSSNQLKFRLFPTSADAITVEGWGKKKLTAYAVSDIATNTGLEFFPTEVQDILVEGVSADIKELQGKAAEAQIKNALFESMIQDLIAEEQKAKPDETPRTYLPDRLRRKWAKRGQGTNVT